MASGAWREPWKKMQDLRKRGLQAIARPCRRSQQFQVWSARVCSLSWVLVVSDVLKPEAAAFKLWRTTLQLAALLAASGTLFVERH